MNLFGKYMVIPGTNVINPSMKTITAQKGTKDFNIFDIGKFAIPDDTNRVIPTGGVLIPIARFVTVMRPKCMGSTPNFVTIGNRMGTIRIIAGVVSRIVPKNNSIILININIIIGFCVIAKIAAAILTGTCWFVKIHDSMAVAATQNITTAVVTPLSMKILGRSLNFNCL
jgi:hypothetical protein